MSHTYPVMVNQPRIKLKAIRRRGAGSRGGVGSHASVTFSKSRSKARPRKLQVHELVGEAYTVLSAVAIIAVLIYHIAG